MEHGLGHAANRERQSLSHPVLCSNLQTAMSTAPQQAGQPHCATDHGMSPLPLSVCVLRDANTNDNGSNSNVDGASAS